MKKSCKIKGKKKVVKLVLRRAYYSHNALTQVIYSILQYQKEREKKKAICLCNSATSHMSGHATYY